MSAVPAIMERSRGCKRGGRLPQFLRAQADPEIRVGVHVANDAGGVDDEYRWNRKCVRLGACGLFQVHSPFQLLGIVFIIQVKGDVKCLRRSQAGIG